MYICFNFSIFRKHIVLQDLFQMNDFGVCLYFALGMSGKFTQFTFKALWSLIVNSGFMGFYLTFKSGVIIEGQIANMSSAYMTGGFIIGLILALVTIFKKHLSPREYSILYYFRKAFININFILLRFSQQMDRRASLFAS